MALALYKKTKYKSNIASDLFALVFICSLFLLVFCIEMILFLAHSSQIQILK